MSTLFGAPALNPLHRYLRVLLLRLQRSIDRLVADMLANWEREALRLTPNQRVEGRQSSSGGIETLAFRSVVVSLLASTVTGGPTVRIPDRSGGPRDMKKVCSDPVGS